MRQIADAIEYSPTAIYLHFKDKKAVMDAICDDPPAVAAARERAQAFTMEATLDKWLELLQRIAGK